MNLARQNDNSKYNGKLSRICGGGSGRPDIFKLEKINDGKKREGGVLYRKTGQNKFYGHSTRSKQISTNCS